MAKARISARWHAIRTFGKKVRVPRAVGVALVFAVTGVIILVTSHAATPTVSIEPENGNFSGNVTRLSDSTASGSYLAKFGGQVANNGVPIVKVGSGANAGKFVDGNGNAIQMRGVGVPGLEIGCADQYPGTIMQAANGAGNYQVNPSTYLDYYKTVAASLLKWDNPGTPSTGPHAINTIRLPLNEECWLGINQAESGQTAALYSKVSGAVYQQFVKNLVDSLTAQHIYVVLDLHIGANGTHFTDYYGYGSYTQPLDANSDHSITFWDQISKTFNANNGYPNVIYGLENEPFIRCLTGGPNCPYSENTSAGNRWAEKLHRDGGPYQVKPGTWDQGGDAYNYGVDFPNMTFPVAGTQNMLNQIRKNSPNVAIVNGLGGGGPASMEYMGAFMPKDSITPAQLGVEMHSYTGYGSDVVWNESTYTWDMTNGKDENGNLSAANNIEGHYPLIFGEVGDFNGIQSGFPNPYNIANPTYYGVLFSIMNHHNWSYLGYGWTTVQGNNNMLNDLPTATPATGKGVDFKTQLQLQQGKAVGTP